MRNHNGLIKKIFTVLLIFASVFTLYACKDKVVNEYKVTFENSEVGSEYVKDGQKVTKPNNPTKKGFVFDNWYKDSEFNELYDFNLVVEKDITIYAFFYAEIATLVEIGLKLDHNTLSKEKYYTKARIKSISNTDYGNMIITNGLDDIGIYGLNGINDEQFKDILVKPIVGDTIYLRGPLKNFNSSVELNGANLIRISDEVYEEDIDINDYTSMSILDARSKAIDTKVLVEGVVSNITLANSRKPNGVYLVDGTNSIYIYSNEIATSVKVGDKIQVAASRANFILADEQGFAESYGYEGAIQLDNAYLIKNVSSGNARDLSWVEDNSIKEMLNTDYKDNNITSTIFKVNAFINKVDGNGFTNYYFNDLDNITGSYSYSMNNGSDFKWLDEYDGQLRTVYLSVINAKATASGIHYRFIPIAIDEVYNYDQAYNSEYAVKYHGVDQLEESYVAGYSPDLELVTNVSSKDLNITNVKLEYTSSNINVASIEEVNGKTIFKTKNAGISVITIKATDGDNSYQEEVIIQVLPEVDYKYINVLDSSLVEDNTEVIVKGIVGASLVNKIGFYLIDETGIIAVQLSAIQLSGIKLGNEVIVKGIKKHIGAKDDAVGQIAIDEAEVVQNYQGNHEYSTTSFKTDKVLADFKELNKLEDLSTTVYVFEATIKYVETAFYTKYELSDDEGNTFPIYSASGKQLSFLENHQNKKVTVEFTVVNWNGKNYSGSIISIIDGDTKIASNQNFK